MRVIHHSGNSDEGPDEQNVKVARDRIVGFPEEGSLGIFVKITAEVSG